MTKKPNMKELTDVFRKRWVEVSTRMHKVPNSRVLERLTDQMALREVLVELRKHLVSKEDRKTLREIIEFAEQDDD